MGGTGCVDSCAPEITILGSALKEFYVCECQLLGGLGKVVERDFGFELQELIARKKLLPYISSSSSGLYINPMLDCCYDEDIGLFNSSSTTAASFCFGCKKRPNLMVSFSI